MHSPNDRRENRYEYLSTRSQLEDFCGQIAGAPSLALDTEFVSEDTYRPQLCLVQVAVGPRLAVIDPLAIEDLTPFWQLLVAQGHETVVHAGRHEFQFCTAATGKRPAGWFDVQLAAGFVGLEYPAAYGTLIARLLGRSLPKAETRTNWRHRPLSPRQLEYAVQDVVFLEPIRDKLREEIEKLRRQEWLQEELERWQQQAAAGDHSEGWQRLPGLSGLAPRQLAIVRELWRWREEQAEARNCPPRRVLRDDLLVELARRQTNLLSHIRAVRGLEHRHLQRHLPEISERIRRARALDESACPQPVRRSNQAGPPLNLLGQFLSAALASVCQSAALAPALVGTAQDVRDLIAYRLGLPGRDDQAIPALARGWRIQVVGQVIEDLLAGRLAVRVRDPLAENPLAFEPPCHGSSTRES